MPREVSDSVLGYQYARWLEEGRTHGAETKLKKEDSANVGGGEVYNEDEDESVEESDLNDDEKGTCGGEDGEEHLNLRMQWKWTELRV
jgi:hypothetical protein